VHLNLQSFRARARLDRMSRNISQPLRYPIHLTLILRAPIHAQPHPLCNLPTTTTTSPTPSPLFNTELKAEVGECHWRRWDDNGRRDDDIAMAMRGKPEAPGAVTPQRKIELFSGTYFAACMLGGVIGIPFPVLSFVLTTLH